MLRAKVFYILLVTLIGILFLFRESVNIYWAQTYHAESPLAILERSIHGQLNPSSIEIEHSGQEIVTLAPESADDEVLDKNPQGIDESAQLAIKTAEIEESQVADKTIEPVSDFFIPKKDAELAGPMIPQLPKEAILTAGDKIFFVGDSMMQGVAPRIRQALYKSENIDSVDLSKQSTGLAYPSFYNWPKVVEDTLASDKSIKAIVVYLGANDPWDFQATGRKRYLKFMSPEWEREYRERIQKILLSANQYNLPVIWLGAPCMRKEKLHDGMVYLNTVYQSEVERFNGTYLPTSDVLGCSDEGYNAYAQTDKGNQKVRTNDGIHFTVTGQRLVGNRVIDSLTIIRPEPTKQEETEVVEPIPAQASHSDENLHKDGSAVLSKTVAETREVTNKELHKSEAVKPVISTKSQQNRIVSAPKNEANITKKTVTAGKPSEKMDNVDSNSAENRFAESTAPKTESSALNVVTPKVDGREPLSNSVPREDTPLQWADGTIITPVEMPQESTPQKSAPNESGDTSIWYTE